MIARFDYSGSGATTTTSSKTTTSTNSYTKAATTGAASGATRAVITEKKIYDAKTSVSQKAADLIGQAPRVSQPDYLLAGMKGAGIGAVVGLATQYAKDTYVPAFQQGGWGGVLSRFLQDATLYVSIPQKK